MKQQIKIPTTKYHVMADVVCLCLFGLVAILLLTAWDSLPDKVPTHYNFSGKVDGMGNRDSILLMPCMMAAMYILLKVTEKFPGVWNTGVKLTEENRDAVYLELKNMIVVLRLVIVAAFSYITMNSIYLRDLSSMFIPIMLICTFGPIVYFMKKIKDL